MPFVSHAERAKRRALGLCTRCITDPPQPVATGKRSCPACLMERKHDQRYQRASERDSGRCACGTYRRMGRATCRGCAALAFLKARMKEQLLVDMGICVKCMQRPARSRCNKKERERSRSTGAKNHWRERFTDCIECAARRTNQRSMKKLSRIRDELVMQAKQRERDLLEHD